MSSSWNFLLTTPILSALLISSVSAEGDSFYLEKPIPFLVSITDTAIHICSGSVLNLRTILTTALCMENPTPLKVLAFSTACHSSSFDDPSAFDIIKRYRHPKFNRFTLFADVAVVHVDRNLDKAGDVVPIPLLNRPVAQDESLKVYGWNFDFVIEMDTSDLGLAKTKALDSLNCVHHYGPQFLVGEMLCVEGWSFVNKSAEARGCEMDPGGPATLSVDKEKYLVGLSSFTGGCLYKGWPAVFQDTFPYYHWIMERLYTGEEEE